VTVALAPPHATPSRHGETGALLVLEGIDRSGRSTHARRLEAHFRHAGRGVARTSHASSVLAAEEMRRLRTAGRADPTEMALLAAADLAERLDQAILPALRAGLVVIADRYRWTPMARAEARGIDPAWLDGLYSFAPAPDAVLYLDIPPRISRTRLPAEPDPYEAGADLGLSDDLLAGYELFQDRLHACFERFAERDGFTRVPGDGSVDAIAARLVRLADLVAEGAR
jgi:dTMP kinase